jgi:outer membrane protein TolC
MELKTGVPLQLLSRRPDVRQAELNLAQAFYNTNAARSEFYPKITLGGTLGWTSAGAAIASPGSWLLRAIGDLMQPVFNRGLNKSRLRVAEARQEQALLLFRQSLLDAGVEVNNALVQWQTAQNRLDIDKKQIVNLRAAVWNTKLMMKHGLTNYLEVLTAQQSLLQAELAEISDTYLEIQGVIQLYHALGGGAE